MILIIKEVAVDNPDLIRLVTQLNNYFLEEWGEETTSHYDSHQVLSKMSGAFIAYVDDVAAACGCWKQYELGIGQIKRMFVAPHYRRLGLAGRVLETLESVISHNQNDIATLETGASMSSAIRFYEKQGYNIVPNYGEFMDDPVCVCMQKKLSI